VMGGKSSVPSAPISYSRMHTGRVSSVTPLKACGHFSNTTRLFGQRLRIRGVGGFFFLVFGIVENGRIGSACLPR